MGIHLAAALAAAVNFIVVHGIANLEINVNIAEISSIRPPRDKNEGGHLTDKVNCIIVMTNNRFYGVVETCPEVVDLIAKVNK